MFERIAQDAKPSVQRAIGRITRSSANMHSLITTLLWISRDNHHDLAVDNIDLHQMVDDVVQELDYLAGDKTIAISIEGITGQILKDQVHELVRIVVVNLIRNAIQHSQQDTIKIKLSGSSLSIENTTTDTIDNTADVQSTSFGVGLYLVEKICAKQHWHFETQPQADTFKVTVNFST